MNDLDTPAVVLFDWNGTLIDDMERARQASSLVRQQWADLPELTLDEFRRAWCLPLSSLVERLGVPEAHTEAAARAWSTHLTQLDAPLSAGTVATLEALGRAGIRTAVVSAASDYSVRKDLLAHRLDSRFDDVHCGVADKQAVIRRYVVQTRQGAVWYVGDTKHDMMQACRAGAVAIGYAGGYDAVEALSAGGARRLVSSMDELLAFIPRSP